MPGGLCGASRVGAARPGRGVGVPVCGGVIYPGAAHGWTRGRAVQGAGVNPFSCGGVLCAGACVRAVVCEARAVGRVVCGGR